MIRCFSGEEPVFSHRRGGGEGFLAGLLAGRGATETTVPAGSPDQAAGWVGHAGFNLQRAITHRLCVTTADQT